MTHAIFVARKENAGILDKTAAELNIQLRKIIMDEFSLSTFLKSELKSYMFHNPFIFDVSCCEEQGDDFIALLEGITLQKDDAEIVVYAGNFYAGDEFLDKLVHCGFTNIAANYSDVDEKTNIEMMAADLKECLQEGGLPKQKWRRYDKSFDAFAEAREMAAIAEKEKAKPVYSEAGISVAVVGAQSRIGTTSFAIHLADYFRGRSADAVVVSVQQKGQEQLEMLCDMFEGQSENGIYSIKGIDFCVPSSETDKKYNAEIYDFGNTDTSGIDFSEFHKVYLIGGTLWNELPMVYTAQIPMNKVNYTVALNFSNREDIDKFRDILSPNLNEVICAPYEPDPFSSAAFEDIFDKAFEDFRDKEEVEEQINY